MGTPPPAPGRVWVHHVSSRPTYGHHRKHVLDDGSFLYTNDRTRLENAQRFALVTPGLDGSAHPVASLPFADEILIPMRFEPDETGVGAILRMALSVGNRDIVAGEEAYDRISRGLLEGRLWQLYEAWVRGDAAIVASSNPPKLDNPCQGSRYYQEHYIPLRASSELL